MKNTSLAPWLSIGNTHKALDFYKAAFDAVETYRMDVPDGVIARLSVHGAEFWIGTRIAEDVGPVGGDSVRMILTVDDPDAVFAKAIAAGAIEIFPVGEDHGWRLGRIMDPFGLNWEIGKEV